MTIAILVQNLRIGGIQRLAVDEANEFARRGHDVFVITFEHEQEGNSMRAFLMIPEQRCLYVAYPRLRSCAGKRILVKELKRIRPDLILTHHWFANTVGRVAARLAGIQRVLSFEHNVYDTVKPRIQWILDWLLQYLCLRVIAVSEPVRDSLIRHDIRASRIALVSNGIDLSGFSPASHPAPATNLTYVGRLVAFKNLDVLITALSNVPEAMLRIVGDGPERRALEALAGRLGVQSRVEFLGNRQDISDILRTTGALALPSSREGFGIVLVEALASGVPIIVSRLAAFAGIVRDGENGLMAVPGDVDDLAAAIRRFISDATLQVRLRKGTQQGIERYSIAAHADALLSLI